MSKLSDQRPWGKWEILLDEPYCKVKRITVLPLQRLSYQSHQKRKENWIIVQGSAKVTLNDEVRHLASGDQITIPIQAKHRIENQDASTTLIFIEVQTGHYFGEDDIERFSDDYGRA